MDFVQIICIHKISGGQILMVYLNRLRIGDSSFSQNAVLVLGVHAGVETRELQVSYLCYRP